MRSVNTNIIIVLVSTPTSQEHSLVALFTRGKRRFVTSSRIRIVKYEGVSKRYSEVIYYFRCCTHLILLSSTTIDLA